MLRWLPTRWRRFSIRTLFIAITLVGVAAGLIGIHVRNRIHLQSVRWLVTSAHCNFYVPHRRTLLQLNPSWNATIEIPLDAISPEGFTALQKAAERTNPRERQKVDRLFLTCGPGQADVPRTKEIMAAFQPKYLHLRRLKSDETACLLNGRDCLTIDVDCPRGWSSRATIDLRCRNLLYRGGGFADFWRCVSPQSSVAKVYLCSDSPADFQDILPIPSLEEFEIAKLTHVDECDVVQLMSRMHGVLVRLKCCGLDEEQEQRLRDVFAPNLLIERERCSCFEDPFG